MEGAERDGQGQDPGSTMLHTVSAETAAESARLPAVPKQMASNVKSSGVKLCKM